MIPIETLKQVTHVYCHGHCLDGLASAMILKDAFRMLGMSPRIEFLVHGTDEHQAAGREVTCSTTGEAPAWSRPLFCDIAPHDSYGSQQGCRDNGAIVLDHHVGAKDIVESFGSLGVYADAEKEPGVSGAVLAFREVWEPVWLWIYGGGVPVPNRQFQCLAEVEDFAICIGARDTWQTKDPRFMRGQWISKMLMSKPASYWLGPIDPRPNGAVPAALDEREIQMGRALFEAHEEAVRQAVEQCVMTVVASQVPPPPLTGRITPYVLYVFQEQASGFRLCSDVAEALREKQKIAGVVAGFSYVVDKPGGQPRLLYSLRGLGGFDVQKFATANGGGGHKAAAGFSVDPQRNDVKNPYEAIRYRLEEFLRGIDK